MSMQIGFVLLALAAGIAVGLVVAGRRVGSRSGHDGDGVAAARIHGQLEAQGAELRRLADAAAGRDLTAQDLRTGLEDARRALERLQLQAQERRGAEDEQRDVVRRLATVLAGGPARGRAGEHVLRQQLAHLPPAMLVTDYRVGGKVVEFGLRLPDGRRLPVDSKWTAVAELQALEAATDASERHVCARAVERAVTLRAREVAQYLDPALTAPVAVAAIPDAAYQVLERAHAEAFARGVVIVPYGSALPIVLFLYSLVQRFGDVADVQASLAAVAGVLDALESVVENRFARAGTMIANGADEFRSQLGKARGCLARAHVASDDGPQEDGQEEGPVVAFVR